MSGRVAAAAPRARGGSWGPAVERARSASRAGAACLLSQARAGRAPVYRGAGVCVYRFTGQNEKKAAVRAAPRAGETTGTRRHPPAPGEGGRERLQRGENPAGRHPTPPRSLIVRLPRTRRGSSRARTKQRAAEEEPRAAESGPGRGPEPPRGPNAPAQGAERGERSPAGLGRGRGACGGRAEAARGAPDPPARSGAERPRPGRAPGGLRHGGGDGARGEGAGRGDGARNPGPGPAAAAAALTEHEHGARGHHRGGGGGSAEPSGESARRAAAPGTAASPRRAARPAPRPPPANRGRRAGPLPNQEAALLRPARAAPSEAKRALSAWSRAGARAVLRMRGARSEPAALTDRPVTAGGGESGRRAGARGLSPAALRKAPAELIRDERRSGASEPRARKGSPQRPPSPRQRGGLARSGPRRTMGVRGCRGARWEPRGPVPPRPARSPRALPVPPAARPSPARNGDRGWHRRPLGTGRGAGRGPVPRLRRPPEPGGRRGLPGAGSAVADAARLRRAAGTRGSWSGGGGGGKRR